ncbi:MAG TPA: alpha/beta hydrolase [Caldilineae bacterium]|nr:alpha/beta hydrolase [Caldilineae bacterium]HIQ11458.1 alpha/beta hydrolase [Caldilineales bacterium]
MKWLLIVVGALVLASLAVYLWPAPKKDFAALGDRVDSAARQSLLTFRAQYPPQWVQVDGEDWEYAVFGDGEKTILFLHGMMGAYDIWWQQMEVLAPDYRVISVTYPAVDTLEGMSKGVLAVLDAAGVTQTHVVGSSLGGYLAQYLVAAHPERIEKAVFGNTFPPNDLYAEKNAKLINILPFLPSWLVMTTFRGNIETQVYPASGYSELVRAYLLEQTYGRMSKAQVAARAKAVIEPFTPAHPHELGISVMIIEADNDPLVPEVLREQLKATYSAARVETLHDVGHFPYLNAPDVYTERLRAFFQ